MYTPRAPSRSTFGWCAKSYADSTRTTYASTPTNGILLTPDLECSFSAISSPVRPSRWTHSRSSKLWIGQSPPGTRDKDVHRLLGFTNFIRQYIPLYAQITAPLERLKNIKKFKLEGAQLQAFTMLKQLSDQLSTGSI